MQASSPAVRSRYFAIGERPKDGNFKKPHHCQQLTINQLVRIRVEMLDVLRNKRLRGQRCRTATVFRLGPGCAIYHPRTEPLHPGPAPSARTALVVPEDTWN